MAEKELNLDDFKPEEQRYLYDLYEDLTTAWEEGDYETADIKSRAIQSFMISQETVPEKFGKAFESTVQGLWKGSSILTGLPVDITNVVLAMGEKGVRKVMNEIGFEVEPNNKIISDKPFLGGKQVEELLNKVGIETNYDKTRFLTAITGRIAEEVGLNVPLMGLTLYGATPANMAKLAAFETSAAIAAGTGAYYGQQLDKRTDIKYPGTNIPVNLEAWGQALGYLSPLTISSTYKLLDKMTGLNQAIGTLNPFKTYSVATKQAANILFSRMNEDQITKLLTDLEKKNMSKEAIEKKYGLSDDETALIFGESVNQTMFPRTLDEILGGDDLAILKKQIMDSPDGIDLIQALDAYKLTRMHHLENTLRKKITPEDYLAVKKGDVIPGSVSLAIENRIAGINEFVSGRIALAEQMAAEKMAIIGPNISRSQATKILRTELEEGLSDMQRMEKQLWGKVVDDVDAGSIGDKAMEILQSQFKTTPKNSIPPILKKLAGDERQAAAGMIEQADDLPVGLLDNEKQSVNELLNLKSLVHDEIRKAVKMGTKEGDTLAANYKSLLDEVNDTLLSGVPEKSIEAAESALSYTNTLQKDIYESSIGNLLEYNTTKGNPSIINAKKFEELVSKGEAGGITSADFLNVLNGESAGLQAKIKDDVARLIDPRTEKLPAVALEKYIRNNEEIINQFPDLKKQLLDADQAKILVEDRLALHAKTEKDLANYRANTLLSDSQLGLSNNTIIKNVFGRGNAEDKLQAVDNIVTILNKGDDSGLALQGFQDAVTDHIFNTIKPVGKTGKKTLDLKTATNFINDNTELLVKLYGDDGARMWQEFSDTLVAVEPALISGNVGRLAAFDKNNIFISAIGRITGAKAGAMGLGPPLVLAGLGGRRANKIMGTSTEKETMRILAKAFRDPDFAANLIRPVNEKVQGEIAERLNRFIKDDNAVLTTTIRVGTESFKESGERLTEDEEEEVPVSENTISPASDRFAGANMFGPVGMGGEPSTAALGKELFGNDPREITFANQGGIMSTNKAFQRVA